MRPRIPANYGVSFDQPDDKNEAADHLVQRNIGHAVVAVVQVEVLLATQDPRYFRVVAFVAERRCRQSFRVCPAPEHHPYHRWWRGPGSRYILLQSVWPRCPTTPAICRRNAPGWREGPFLCAVGRSSRPLKKNPVCRLRPRRAEIERTAPWRFRQSNCIGNRVGTSMDYIPHEVGEHKARLML